MNLIDPYGLYTAPGSTSDSPIIVVTVWAPEPEDPPAHHGPNPDENPGSGRSGGGSGSGPTSTSTKAKQIGVCFLKGAAKGAVGAVAVGALAVGAVAFGAPVAAVTGVLGGLAVFGGAALGIDVIQKIRSGNSAGIAYDVGSLAGGVAVGAAGGGALANGIKPGATSGWSPASWVAQRFRPSLGSFGQWLGTGPTAASGGMSAALAGGGAAQATQGGCK